MLNKYFKSTKAKSRYAEGLASPFWDDFIAWLENTGYRRSSIRHYVQGVYLFAEWAETRGLSIQECNRAVLEKFRHYFAIRKSLHYRNGRCNNVFQSARVFVNFLEANGIVETESRSSTSQVPVLLREFDDWMRVQRGASDRTLAKYHHPILDLLQRLGDSPEAYTAKDLRGFLLWHIERSTQGTTKNLTTSIRMFLRFLIARGSCAVGLEHAIPSVASWRLSTLPRYLPMAEVEQLIESCDDSSPIGARDRAMFLLMARLGLRAGDVAALKFADCKWAEAMLVVSGKNRRETNLPLPQDVGDAILHYVNRHRPRLSNNYDQIFITSDAPFGPLAYQTVGKAVARALVRTGVKSHTRGSHLLRHSLATSLLRNGLSLPSIGALLRHSSIETTAIYAKVDLALLKEVTMPWMEV